MRHNRFQAQILCHPSWSKNVPHPEASFQIIFLECVQNWTLCSGSTYTTNHIQRVSALRVSYKFCEVNLLNIFRK